MNPVSIKYRPRGHQLRMILTAPLPAYFFSATLHIHRQSAYLVGREKRVADIVVDHPSCSKQHAVVQFRLFEKVDDKEGTTRRSVRWAFFFFSFSQLGLDWAFKKDTF